MYATLQSLGPAILTLWLVGPARLTNGTTALAVAVGGLVVVLPGWTHILAKRIALGQIVLVYVIAFINGAETDAVMHPLRLAASTAVGVLACVLALLLPYPRLACFEVRQNCKLLAENASERLNLYVKALCAQDNALGFASISRAKLLNVNASKLLQSINRYQDGVKWERLPFKFLSSYYMNSKEKLGEIEMALRGMELALENISSFPHNITLDGELKDGLLNLEEHITLTIKQTKNYSPCDSSTVPESDSENIVEFLQTLHTIPESHQDLPSFFFLFCMNLLHTKSSKNPPLEKVEGPKCHSSKLVGLFSLKGVFESKRLLPAFKLSLSLGLSVFFGLVYSKPNGYWSGLPVAISLAAAREATFKVANVKAQGTVLGTVYGVFGCFVFERFLPIRFLSLLPWFIFSSFLRQSRMYGQAGGISAVIGAILILGRKNFGPPSEFAIARITETFIGLSCSIIVDLLFQPTRGSTLAQTQLSKSLTTLHDCLGSLSLGKANSLFEKQKQLKMDVNELEKFIGEADAEPDFWFLPFNSACYKKLSGSLSKMRDIFVFSTQAVTLLESEKLEARSKGVWVQLDKDLKRFKEYAKCLMKCLAEISAIKSLASLDKELAKSNISADIELGKLPDLDIFRVCDDQGEDKMGKMLSLFLEHSREVMDKIEEKEMKSRVVLSLSALGYCMRSFTKEIREIEGAIRELVQWENPTSHVNLHEISCKIHSLYTKNNVA